MGVFWTPFSDIKSDFTFEIFKISLLENTLNVLLDKPVDMTRSKPQQAKNDSKFQLPTLRRFRTVVKNILGGTMSPHVKQGQPYLTRGNFEFQVRAREGGGWGGSLGNLTSSSSFLTKFEFLNQIWLVYWPWLMYEI